jgi:hypothetical protein
VIGPRVPAVHLVEVDPICLQALERGLDLAYYPAPRVARFIQIPPTLVAHRAVELGGKHDVLASPAAECLADDFLRLPARVHVGGVDEVDPAVQGSVDDADRRVMVGLAPRAEHHRAEAQRAHVHARVSQCARIHGATLARGCAMEVRHSDR